MTEDLHPDLHPDLHLYLNTRTRYLMAETWDLKSVSAPSQPSGLRFPFV